MRSVAKLFAIAALSSGLGLFTAAAEEATAVETAEPSPLSSVLMDNDEACRSGPAEQFGRYLGDWDIQDWRLSSDGTRWDEQQGARWNFVCVGNGIAVQDFWMPNAGGTGTNLRMFNPDTESWDIAWTATSQPGLTHINAREDEHGNIVMHYVSPSQTPKRRITFFPPDETGWDWTLEFSQDDGESWMTVYKIRATPRD